jgi:GLPGLI family protein
MKKLLFIVLPLVYGSSFSQNYKITYLKSSNGSLIENQDPVLVFTSSEVTQIGSQSIFNGKADFPNEIIFVDRKTNSFSQVADLDATKTINSKDSVSLGKQTFEYLNDTKKILGYNCKKANTIVNSNNIELWYTNELKVKGAPTILGQNLGLVLEMVRNGNFVIKATNIERIKMFPTDPDLSKSIDVLTYKDLLWKSRFTTINVFKDQVINFSSEAKSNDSILRFANGTIAVRKIKIPEIKVGSQIFVDVTEQSNGDAYDRTGSFFIIPNNKTLSFLDGLLNGAKTLPIYNNGNGKEYQGVVATENYNPVVELMRFFTPFG